LLVVFDLDGTLIDGYAAIGEALSHATSRLGVAEVPPERVRVLVGHGLERLLESVVGAARAAEGVRLFRERYPEVAVAGSHLMPGAREALGELSAAGHELALASNKPARFSGMILEALGIARFFREIAGPDETTPAKPDPAMLRRLMRGAGVDPAATLAVGDMEVDVEFARAAGCRVAVLPGGSRSREELRKARPDALLDGLADVPGWVASIVAAS
jgi:phosphoglycolate phosphatase